VRGVSLVEFLAACVVVGILIVLVLWFVGYAREKTRITQVQHRCSELTAAAHRYEMETGRPLVAFDELLASELAGWLGPYTSGDDRFCDPWGSAYVLVRGNGAVQVISSNALPR